MHPSLEQYLREVERRLGTRPSHERADILSALRQHIEESLARHGNDPNAVLAELDDPVDYGEPLQGRSPGPREWFLLALAFLALNGWAVWRWTHPRPAEPDAPPAPKEEPAPHVAAVETPLRLLSAQQAELTADRRAAIWLAFSRPPDVRVLEKFLRLRVGEQDVPFEVASQTTSNFVLLRTGMVERDDLDILLNRGLPVLNAPVLLEEDAKITLRLTDQLQLQRVSAECPAFEQPYLDAWFSGPIDLKTAADFISVQPPVRFAVEPVGWWGSGCRLRGDFEPGSVYAVTFRAGLRSESGASISRDAIRRVQFPARPPSIAFPTTGAYLSPAGRLQIPISVMNVDRVEVAARPILAQNIVQYVVRSTGRLGGFYGESDDLLTGSGQVLTHRFAGPANREIKSRLDLRELAGPDPRGVYLVSAWNEKAGVAKQLVVVTDLGISARIEQDGGLFVWINSLAGATPLNDVQVAALSENNDELARGRTDENGIARLALSGPEEPVVITARLGHDFSYLALDESRVRASGADTPGRPFLRDGYEAFLFTDRGIYRPGEIVHLKAFVRDADLKCPDAFPARFRIIRPDGKLFRELPVMLDSWGAAETNFVAEAFLPTGLYRLQLALPGSDEEIGASTVAVEEFVPPQIRAAIQPPAGAIAAGESFSYDVQAEHLFGRPAAGLTVSGRVQFEPIAFVPAAWSEFVFGDREKKFGPSIVEVGQGALDESGRARFAVKTSSAWRPPARIRAVLGATVTESSGRAVSAYASAELDPYPLYIGLRASADGAARVGEAQKVEVVAVRPDGAPAFTNGALKLSLFRSQWNSVLKRQANGRYGFESAETLTPVLERAIPISDSPAAVPFKVEASGEYLLVVTDPESGSSASRRFVAASADSPWVDWSRERPERVELKFDRDAYSPGDTARLIVRSPFSGPALFTIETDRIREYRRMELTGNTAEVEIPVRSDFAPNVHAALTVIRPAVAESAWSAHRAVGTASLNVRVPDRMLKVELDAPETHRPQSRLIARVRTLDESGAPSAASVTVMAVDEGICSLTAFATPDPLAFFTAPRAIGTEWFDLYSQLMPVLDDELNAGASHTAGGAGSSLLRRLNPISARRFKPVALWVSNVLTDSNGWADVAMDVPEFTGELRLMAVAGDRSRFGRGERAVKVKRPLIVEPSLPRFLAPGDTAGVGIRIFNETGKDQQVHAQVTCGGPLSVSDAELAFSLSAGGATNIRLNVVAGDAPGRALWKLDVEAGGERYAETIELPVRPALPEQIRTEFGMLAAGESRSFEPSGDWVPGTAQSVVWCGARPEVRFARSLDYLLNYPYGCLEQTVSASLPLVRLPQLAGQVQPGTLDRAAVEHLVQAGILRVISMQQPNGGFSMWPNQRATWTWGSLYAALFLVESERAGFAVPRDVREAALKFTRDLLDRRPPAEADDVWRADMEERAFACRVLAQAGSPSAGWAARLDEQSELLTTVAKIHTAAALASGGEPRKAAALFKRIGDGAADTAECAWLLLAWLDLDPESPIVAEMVRRLDAQQAGGHWGTTTANALALLALGRRAEMTRPDPRPFRGTIEADGSAAIVDSQRPSVLTNAGAFRLSNDGPGPMYFSVRSAGVPRVGSADERDDGIAVRREWLDAQGEPWDGDSAAQGDLLVCRITLDAGERMVENLAVEERLPAGFEIENPALLTSQRLPWMTGKSDWCVHRDIRDDRLILFTGAFSGSQSYYYAARAVTPGQFVQPPITASGMYEPALRSVSGAGRWEIAP